MQLIFKPGARDFIIKNSLIKLGTFFLGDLVFSDFAELLRYIFFDNIENSSIL